MRITSKDEPMKNLAQELSVMLDADVTFEIWDVGRYGWRDYMLYINGELVGLVLPNYLMALPTANEVLGKLDDEQVKDACQHKKTPRPAQASRG